MQFVFDHCIAKVSQIGLQMLPDVAALAGHSCRMLLNVHQALRHNLMAPCLHSCCITLVPLLVVLRVCMLCSRMIKTSLACWLCYIVTSTHTGWWRTIKEVEPTGEGTHNKTTTLAVLAHHKATSNPTTPHFSVYTMASESFWPCMYWR